MDKSTKNNLKYIAYGVGIFIAAKWFIKGLFSKQWFYFWVYLAAAIIGYLGSTGQIEFLK